METSLFVCVFMSLWCQWVNWGYSAWLGVCDYHQGGDLQTHTLETWGPILATQVILEWRLRKEGGEYFYLHLHSSSLLSYPSSVASAALTERIELEFVSDHSKITVSALLCDNSAAHKLFRLIKKKKIAAGLSAFMQGKKMKLKQQRDWRFSLWLLY